jgi:sugar phosphate isomerase/epimerase
MKLAYMYATSDVTHSKVTAVQGDASNVLDQIRNVGYSGVELLVADPALIDRRALRRAVEDSGLDVPAICTGEVYGQAQLSFADPDPARRREARGRMNAAMELAAEYGAMVNVGRLRGRYTDGVDKQQTLDWIVEAISEATAHVPDVPVVLEPVNHEYANCLITTKDAVEFINAAAIPSLGLMLDSVHIRMENEEVADACALAGEHFQHFHITDSDRLPVGDGEYDIMAIMVAVAASGFDAYTTVETFQIPDATHGMTSSWAALQKVGIRWSA